MITLIECKNKKRGTDLNLLNVMDSDDLIKIKEFLNREDAVKEESHLTFNLRKMSRFTVNGAGYTRD